MVAVSTRLQPLSEDNKVGNGSPVMADLIRVQSAILKSNAATLGAVGQFQKDIGGRLDRQFGEVAQSLQTVEGKVDDSIARLGCIEEARRLDAALAAQAKVVATERNVDRAAHALSYNQRLAITVAAISGVGALALGVLTMFLRLIGALQ